MSDIQSVFRIHVDPGHAWAECPSGLLKLLGIDQKVSTYSYQRDGMAYLEEDCDLGLLVRALRDRGIEPVFEEELSDLESPIRKFERYAPQA